MGPYRYKWHPNGGRGRRPLNYDPPRGQGVLAKRELPAYERFHGILQGQGKKNRRG